MEMLGSSHEEAEREASPAQDARVSRQSRGEALRANRAVSGLAAGLLDQGQAPVIRPGSGCRATWTQCRTTKGGALGTRRSPTTEATKVAPCRAWSQAAAKGRRARVYPEGQLRLRSTQRGPAVPVLQGQTAPGAGVQPPGFKKLPTNPSLFQSRCA